MLTQQHMPCNNSAGATIWWHYYTQQPQTAGAKHSMHMLLLSLQHLAKLATLAQANSLQLYNRRPSMHADTHMIHRMTTMRI
jgi:hypothetical protein